MRKQFLAPVLLCLTATLLCLPLTLVGCKTVSTNPPTAPGLGYVDSFDQEIAQDIAASETFYRDQQKAIQAKTYVPTPNELTGLNALGVEINVAKGAAQQYKLAQTSANLTAAQNAANSAKAQFQTLSSQLPASSSEVK